MQIIPATFKRVADSGWDINNPEHNARAGVRYLAMLNQKAGGDAALTATGYYGGEGAIDKARKGIAVSDPRNPNAPNTLEYGKEVASRIPAKEETAPWEKYKTQIEPTQTQPQLENREYSAEELLNLRKQGVNIGDLKLNQPSYKDDLNTELENNPFRGRMLAAGAGVANMVQGAGQFFGRDPNKPINIGNQTISGQRENDIAAEHYPGAALAGDVAGYGAAALAAPAGLVGSSAVMGGLGALKPQDGVDYGDTVKRKLGQGIFEGALNAGITKSILGVGKAALARTQAAKAAKMANSVTDDTLKQSFDAGMQIPRSMYNPSATSNVLESIGGKAALNQAAKNTNKDAALNQVRQSLNLPPNTPISHELMANMRHTAAEPYRVAETLADDVVSTVTTKSPSTGKPVTREIVKNGKQLVEEINIGRDTARALKQEMISPLSNNRNAARAAWVEAEKSVKSLENQLEKMAIKQNKPQLAKDLAISRLAIKKIHDIEDSLIRGGGVDTHALGALYQGGALASDSLKKVGRFANNFREVAPTGEAALKGEGISALMLPTAMISAQTGGAVAGGAGLLAGGLPLLRGPARRLSLSKFMQKPHTYNTPMLDFLTKGAALRNPAMAITGGASPQLLEYNPFE